ncbi:MAG: hypothetical protein WDN24_00610 [Sphingomonas sp.]
MSRSPAWPSSCCAARSAWRKGAGALAGLGTLPALAILGAVSIPVYLLTFLPAFFYAEQPVTLATLIPLQFDMYALQTQVLRPHNYQSDWWSWPLMVRPIWYFYEWDAGAWRGVLLVGNPVVMWGGLIAVGACFAAWLRARARSSRWRWRCCGRHRWRSTSLSPSPWDSIIITISRGYSCASRSPVALRHWGRGNAGRVEIGAVAVALVAFAYFYPILSRRPCATGGGFNDWMWFGSWR